MIGGSNELTEHKINTQQSLLASLINDCLIFVISIVIIQLLAFPFRRCASFNTIDRVAHVEKSVINN